MPRRPAPVKPFSRPTHYLTPQQKGEYGRIVQIHLEGDGTWAKSTVKALLAEANRRLGIKMGKGVDSLRSSRPKEEALMSSDLMDKRFDADRRVVA